MNTEKFSGTLLKVAKKQEKVDILISYCLQKQKKSAPQTNLPCKLSAVQ